MVAEVPVPVVPAVVVEQVMDNPSRQGKVMINRKEPEKTETEQKPLAVPEPDEQSGLVFQGFLKIHDPETGEIITQGRA